eukprot:gb/GFBE01083409.1/.p1 GENE.gb/GFBE01083409.1/~~gb/GFBE01083409.1/.p1  ORF type:complete len:111 (+),score=22.68 gb/GFBE01083409.1/:1-333(+)
MVVAMGRQGAALLSQVASGFVGEVPGAANVSGDSLPLDIHVIIKKASSPGTGAIQVTQPAQGTSPLAAAADAAKAAGVGIKGSVAPVWLALGRLPPVSERTKRKDLSSFL